MTSALDVARYIVNISYQYQYAISNLKLQKLLYFCQAVFLVDSKGKTPCFPEEIEAWDFGPVVPSVYRAFKKYGGNNIPKVSEYKDTSNGIWNLQTKKFSENIITEKDRKKINEVIIHFGKFTASKLVDIIHHQKPWMNAYYKNEDIISKKAIYEYFKEDDCNES